MAEVILICGRICSGKTTYAHQLRCQSKAVLLSIDEVMLSIFGQHCGEKHDEYAARTQQYPFDKSVELIENGIDVILDWGFWTRDSRDAAKAYYTSHGITCRFHYIDVNDATWHARMEERNAAVLEGKTLAYYVDANLASKFATRFEAPSQDEIDVWITV